MTARKENVIYPLVHCRVEVKESCKWKRKLGRKDIFPVHKMAEESMKQLMKDAAHLPKETPRLPRPVMLRAGRKKTKSDVSHFCASKRAFVTKQTKKLKILKFCTNCNCACKFVYAPTTFRGRRFWYFCYCWQIKCGSK